MTIDPLRDADGPNSAVGSNTPVPNLVPDPARDGQGVFRSSAWLCELEAALCMVTGWREDADEESAPVYCGELNWLTQMLKNAIETERGRSPSTELIAKTQTLYAKLGGVGAVDARLLRALMLELTRARTWIKSEGERTDQCTYDILGEICVGCRCGRAGSGGAPNAGDERRGDENLH